uniref:Trans-1,2-dihydrobenzene-1,2-diol dehydrogenase n=1 Tax=Panagrellus redivivus TaxID=6233 RepID=A0A7E4VR06_PANRE
MSKVLRWGIVGCGDISHDFVRAMNHSQRPNKVIAVAASKKERAEAFRGKTNLSNDVKAYGSYDELFADKEVDVVYIGVVNNLHIDVSLKAVKAGKAVLCEKPIGANVKETKKLFDAAEQAKVFLMEATWSRFFPAYQRLRQIINDKSLGKVKTASVLFAGKLPANRFCVELNQTPINDIGSYAVQFALFAFGERPEKVVFDGGKREDGCDLWGTFNLHFSGGRFAVVSYSSDDYGPSNGVVTFDDGYVEFPKQFWSPDTLKLVKGTNEPVLEKFPLPEYEGYNYGNSAGLSYEADHVYDTIAAGKTQSDIHSHDESLKTLEILDEARRVLGVKYTVD